MNNQNIPDYNLFKKWFCENGGFYKKIKFPTYFPPTNYIGISATQTLQANQVFLAIPKKLIITPSKIRKSKLGNILQNYHLSSNSQNQQNDFNVLILFIIWQKMLGNKSFYYPYLQAIGQAQTVISWSGQQIQKIQDPFISTDFVNQLRKQLPPIYHLVHEISINNPQIFNTQITQQIFIQSYLLVTTRCFGWGLPQTMMVPFADFLNHDCNGVYHYVLNRKLEDGVYKYEEEYIKKRNQLDLTLLNIKSDQQNKILRQRNNRQQFVKKHENILQKNVINYKKQNISVHQSLQIIQKDLLSTSFDVDLYPSSNSQDNDSQQQQQVQNQSKDLQRKYQVRKISKLTKQKIQQQFKQTKPHVNRQFQPDVTFDWWNQMNEQDSFFIVATHKNINKNQQIFNSYGRRSNKFLLLYYGFTHLNNKYDSVAFRFWSQQAYSKTGKLIFAKYLTEKDWYQKIKLGNQRYSYSSVTDQFRLKKYNICYELMAFLRYRIIKNKQQFHQLAQNQDSYYKICDLKLQKLVLSDYQKVLQQVQQIYQPKKQRQTINNQARNYFAKVLLNSNRQIIQSHFNGVKYLKNIIQLLIQQKNLIQIFQKQSYWTTKQNDQKNQKEFHLKKFTLDYFKMLSKFIKQQNQ